MAALVAVIRHVPFIRFTPKNDEWRPNMALINLQDFYPFCEDCVIEVSDEVAEFLRESERQERSYIRYLQRYRAYYSLNIHDAFISPVEIFERKHEIEELYAAIDSLPDKQGRRIYAYFILGFSQKEIAQLEGVDASVVCRSIQAGIEKMKNIFLGQQFFPCFCRK